VEELAGVSPPILLESIAKRLIEAVAGRGGVEAICQFLDQLDWIPKLAPLRQSIKANGVFFESALSMCTKEMLKRPYAVRRKEISEFLGATCPKCGFNTTLWNMSLLRNKCPSCKATLTPTLALSTRQLIAQRIAVTPEAALMNVAYDKLAQAYMDTYEALGLALDNLAQIFGWERFRIDQRLLNYMHSYFYGRLAGEQKIAREEKECLQFLVRGNLAHIPLEQAEKLLRLGIKVVKYGYLYEVLRAVGADVLYRETLIEYGSLYDKLNTKIREALNTLYAATARKVRIKKSLGGYYAPCLKVKKANWQSGQLTGEIVLEPVYRMPIFPKADFGAIQTVYGRLGCGKTFLLSSTICYSFYAKRETTLIPLNDKTNSYSLACIPMFAYSKGTAKLMRLLKMLSVEPQGIPAMTVTVLRKGEKIDDINRHPPTIYDRILEIENPMRFSVNFDELMEELKDVAQNYGYSQPVGIIVIRNLQREDRQFYIDVEIASNILLEFDKWRKGNMNRPMRIVLDEVSYMAASHAIQYATDKLMAGATITDFIKESRRNNVSVDAATQLPIEIMKELRNAATNVFFRDLAVSKDKTRSPIDFLLESIQLRDDALKPVIREMNNRGALPKGFWFWYHQPEYDVQLIRPCPPTFCIFDPEAKKSPREILTEYEKQTSEKMVLKSWDEVKRLKPTKPSFLARPRYDGLRF
jgi:ribosomal protein S27E